MSPQLKSKFKISLQLKNQSKLVTGEWWAMMMNIFHEVSVMVPPGNGHPKKIRPSTYVREKMKKKLQSPIMVNESYHHWELVSHIFVDCVGLDCVTCT